MSSPTPTLNDVNILVFKYDSEWKKNGKYKWVHARKGDFFVTCTLCDIQISIKENGMLIIQNVCYSSNVW